jgi:hypothetical protein
MSVIRTGPSQIAPRFYINVSSARESFFALDAVTGTATAQGPTNPGAWSTVIASNNAGIPGRVMLRDMGKTVFVGTMSTVYRKVQIVSPVGVPGQAGATPSGTDYGTGYIELGWFDGFGSAGSQGVWARSG